MTVTVAMASQLANAQKRFRQLLAVGAGGCHGYRLGKSASGKLGYPNIDPRIL